MEGDVAKDKEKGVSVREKIRKNMASVLVS